MWKSGLQTYRVSEPERGERKKGIGSGRIMRSAGECARGEDERRKLPNSHGGERLQENGLFERPGVCQKMSANLSSEGML